MRPNTIASFRRFDFSSRARRNRRLRLLTAGVEALGAAPVAAADDAIAQVVGEGARVVVEDLKPASVVPNHGRHVAYGSEVVREFLVPGADVVAIEGGVAAAPA